jgi:alkanesulfonate monooxygenase SsuD/methylene tetrahydromethanopterin reductase-like flavin-dependent oxidoreductase (luciferase family)
LRDELGDLPLIRVGVQLPEVEYVAGWSDYAAMARAAEESGFDSIWLGDHLVVSQISVGGFLPPYAASR